MSILDLTSRSVDPNDAASLKPQHDLKLAWETLGGHSNNKATVSVLPSIQDAVDAIRSSANGADVCCLITGSLHLVGGVLEVAGLMTNEL